MDEEMLQRVASHQPEEVNADASDEHEEVGLPSLPNFQRNPRDHDQRRENAYVPHLTLHFDKPTMYLCIPLRRIRNALQNESYQTNLGKFGVVVKNTLSPFLTVVLFCWGCYVVIRGEMKLVCSTLAERIEKLKPWLAAHRVVTTKVKTCINLFCWMYRDLYHYNRSGNKGSLPLPHRLQTCHAMEISKG